MIEIKTSVPTAAWREAGRLGGDIEGLKRRTSKTQCNKGLGGKITSFRNSRTQNHRRRKTTKTQVALPAENRKNKSRQMSNDSSGSSTPSGNRIAVTPGAKQFKIPNGDAASSIQVSSSITSPRRRITRTTSTSRQHQTTDLFCLWFPTSP